jgi:hypothetical protein
VALQLRDVLHVELTDRRRRVHRLVHERRAYQK